MYFCWWRCDDNLKFWKIAQRYYIRFSDGKNIFRLSDKLYVAAVMILLRWMTSISLYFPVCIYHKSSMMVPDSFCDVLSFTPQTSHWPNIVLISHYFRLSLVKIVKFFKVTKYRLNYRKWLIFNTCRIFHLIYWCSCRRNVPIVQAPDQKHKEFMWYSIELLQVNLHEK